MVKLDFKATSWKVEMELSILLSKKVDGEIFGPALGTSLLILKGP